MKTLQLKAAIVAMRAILVPASFLLLISNYIVSAAVQGFLIATLAPQLTWQAYAIGACIQATRGLLVFFPIMDSSRPPGGYMGEAVSIAMAVVAVYEIIHLNGSANISSAISLSLGILMLMGGAVEFYLLRVIKESILDDFFKTDKHAKGLMISSTNRTNLKVFKASLKAHEHALLESALNSDNLPDYQSAGTGLSYNILTPNGTGVKSPTLP